MAAEINGIHASPSFWNLKIIEGSFVYTNRDGYLGASNEGSGRLLCPVVGIHLPGFVCQRSPGVSLDMSRVLRLFLHAGGIIL